MLDKIKAGWTVLHAGECVADPAKWKMHQISSNAIAGLIMAIVGAAKVFANVDIPIDEKSAMVVGSGILVIVNVVLTMATTDKIGLPTKPKAVDGSVYDRPDEPRNDRIDYEGGS